MESWFIILIVISLSISAFLKSLLNLLFPAKKIPPGPSTFPIIGNLLWLTKSFFDLEPILRSWHSKLGPVVTLHIGSLPAIFVSDRTLTHQALVQNSAVFADRPPSLGIEKYNSSNNHTINSANYGPTWRLLRRNLTTEILYPSRVKSYSHARKWVLRKLNDYLESESKATGVVRVMKHLQYTMFSLLVLMCFGDKLDEDQIEKIEKAQRLLLLNLERFDVLSFIPSVTKILFRKLWEEYFQIRQNQENIYIPLIRARKELKEQRKMMSKVKEDDHISSYVDSLLDLELPDNKRKLEENEIVSLCSEFLNGGTDTTATALQWIMANLVKYPEIQEKLFTEMKDAVLPGQEVIEEDDLQKLPYLKAVVLEGLRRHPPAHFVLPHAVSEDTVLDKYMVPKNGTINFMVAEMGWDPKVWKDPMAFKPERFLSSENGEKEVFDITGSRELKMMPFGVGRRMCPAYNLAMLHLEFFVANIVWSYEWKAVEGDEIDLSEKMAFTVVMKYPLQACISPRSK